MSNQIQQELLDALKNLGRKCDNELCFCEVAIGNPMVRDHSEACKKARASIAKAEAQHQPISLLVAQAEGRVE